MMEPNTHPGVRVWAILSSAVNRLSQLAWRVLCTSVRRFLEPCVENGITRAYRDIPFDIFALGEGITKISGLVRINQDQVGIG